jgi:hypothetical protein
MNDFAAVGGKRNSLFGVLFREHLEDVRKFRQGGLPVGHEGVAAGDSRYFCHPGPILLAVQTRLVVFELHNHLPSLDASLARKPARSAPPQSPVAHQNTGPHKSRLEVAGRW